MEVVTLLQDLPELRRPVLLAAFRGWNDAGEAASGAMEVLASELDAKPFAEVDAEEYFDFQVARPVVRFTDAGDRALEWPVNRFSWARLPGADRDVVLLDGTEPNLRWRRFTTGVVDLARRLEVETLVTLGALQVDVPHTRAVPITGVATDDDLAGRLGLQRSRYEGPTGITGVLNHNATAAGLRAMSLWAGIPHYLAGTAYHPGSLALAERILSLLEVDLRLDGLARQAVEQREEIGQLVAEDEDLAEYVGELETRSDDTDADGLPGAPVSADDLAAEVERYLRDH